MCAMHPNLIRRVAGTTGFHLSAVRQSAGIDRSRRSQQESVNTKGMLSNSRPRAALSDAADLMVSWACARLSRATRAWMETHGMLIAPYNARQASSESTAGAAVASGRSTGASSELNIAISLRVTAPMRGSGLC